MAKQILNVGTTPNDGTGDTLRDASVKINANFTELYTTVSSAQLPSQTGNTGLYLTTNGTVASWATAGTVTSVSIASTNGFSGTVATNTTTPAITITTSVTGLLKGDGTAVSAATAGTDYQSPVSATGLLKSSGVSGNVSAATAGTDYQSPVSATGLLKSSGVSGNVSAATAGTDYQSPVSATGLLKSNGTSGNITAATAGTDYIAPTTRLVNTSSYTVAQTDYYIGVNYAGPCSITLPALSTGTHIIIKDESGNCVNNPITLLGTIDNNTNVQLAINNGSLTLTYRSGWRII